MKNLFLLLFMALSASLFAQEFEKDNQDYRDEINKEFADPSLSPLTKEDLVNFTALEFFPIDSSYKVRAQFSLYSNPILFRMPTSTDRMPLYSKYGELTFKINGKELTLQVFQNQELIKREGYEDYLFVPFADLTNGGETYGGGRYLDFHIPKSDEVYIDFNKAYNPYCAYSDRYSCPKVPDENYLDVLVEAGVLKWDH